MKNIKGENIDFIVMIYELENMININLSTMFVQKNRIFQCS